MKLNRYGFMMAEVIVVSSVVLIILTTLYISYNKIFSLYETRLNYEDSNLLYDLAYYRDYLIQNDKMDTALGLVDGAYYSLISSTNRPLGPAIMELNSRFPKLQDQIDTVYLFHTAGENLEVSNFTVSNDAAMKEYLEYLSGGTVLLAPDGNKANHVMVMKRKYSSANKLKFAYLVID